MKANLQSAMANGDAAALAAGFERLSSQTPEGYDDWELLAARGVAAARAGDLEGCRVACKQCHDRHRARYRAQQSSQLLRTK